MASRHGLAFLSPPPLSAADYPARDLALPSLHPELPRRGGSARRAWARPLLRNGAALGAEVRTCDRPTAAPTSPSAKQPMAFGRDGGADRRQADVSLASRRSRGRGARHAGSVPSRQPRGAAADAQASQKAGLCTEIAGDRQAALVCLGVPAIGVDLPSRTRAQNEQSGREFSSGGATTRAQGAALQIGQIRPTFPEHARPGPQHFQPSTPPDLPIDPADLQSRGSGAMVRRCRSGMRPDQPIPPFDPTPVTVTKPTTWNGRPEWRHAQATPIRTWAPM